MRPVRRIASLSVLLLLAATAQGQSWPSKPIRVVEFMDALDKALALSRGLAPAPQVG